MIPPIKKPLSNIIYAKFINHQKTIKMNDILDNFEILVLDASDNRIETLQIKKLAKKDD